jgi:hypothetical protein
VRYIVTETMKKRMVPAETAEGLPEDTDTSSLAPYINPEQVTYLEQNNGDCFLDAEMGQLKLLPWRRLPLHYLLTLESAHYARGQSACSAAAADAAYKASAEPLILRLIKNHPEVGVASVLPEVLGVKQVRRC